MKKLFKIALTSALALTLSASALSFVGCGNNKNTPMTEEQWKQAIEATLSATSYKMTIKGEMDSSIEDGAKKDAAYTLASEDDDCDDETAETISLLSTTVSIEYDFVNSIFHAVNENNYESSNSEKFKETDEYYYEIKQDKITSYYKYDNEDWGCDISNELEFRLDFLKYYFSDTYFCPTDGDGSVHEKISELYEYFIYDKQNDSYTAELYSYNTDKQAPNDVKVIISLNFKDGKLSEMSDFIDYIEFATTNKYTITDYNKITVTIPDEVKNAVGQ